MPTIRKNTDKHKHKYLRNKNKINERENTCNVASPESTYLFDTVLSGKELTNKHEKHVKKGGNAR